MAAQYSRMMPVLPTSCAPSAFMGRAATNTITSHRHQGGSIRSSGSSYREAEDFPEEIEARERIAQRYDEALRDICIIPARTSGARSVWAQYTRCGWMRSVVISCAMLSQRKASPRPSTMPSHCTCSRLMRIIPLQETGLPVSARIADEVVSLPMHPIWTIRRRNASFTPPCKRRLA